MYPARHKLTHVHNNRSLARSLTQSINEKRRAALVALTYLIEALLIVARRHVQHKLDCALINLFRASCYQNNEGKVVNRSVFIKLRLYKTLATAFAAIGQSIKTYDYIGTSWLA